MMGWRTTGRSSCVGGLPGWDGGKGEDNDNEDDDEEDDSSSSKECDIICR